MRRKLGWNNNTIVCPLSYTWLFIYSTQIDIEIGQIRRGDGEVQEMGCHRDDEKTN